jgi:alkylated DNA nucleotide flippase Atl1
VDLHWIDGRIAVSARPAGGASLEAEMSKLRSEGVDILVSCLMPSEERELGLVDEASLAEAAGVTFLRARMDDGGTPNDDDSFAQVVENLWAELSSGRRIAVHCRAGVGRSPLTVAAVLVRGGELREVAWRRVAEARGYPVPDNEEQREYLSRFVSRLARR